MNLTQKALRKLGLGDAASRLLSPLAVDRTPLPPVEEARAMLTALRPDAGSSALRAQLLPEVTPACDVDVIIPVYNAEAYLRDCLDSVFSQQTRYSFRVIAVDDGSSDGSGALLDACGDPRLTVIHQENRGLAGACPRLPAMSIFWMRTICSAPAVWKRCCPVPKRMPPRSWKALSVRRIRTAVRWI